MIEGWSGPFLPLSGEFSSISLLNESLKSTIREGLLFRADKDYEESCRLNNSRTCLRLSILRDCSSHTGEPISHNRPLRLNFAQITAKLIKNRV